ncbi:MAG: serine protease [Elusimicrobia bacterium CG08_land_8_20_14_0_20_59_10]|nr:MAG: serine protease [Elusimicrobia bacterium CG08_land_8_20_14_0_20_59_10]
MKKIFTLILAAGAAAVLPSRAMADAKSIYGDDNRLDYYEAAPAMQRLADSVVSLWPSRQVKVEGGDVKLATIGFGTALNLCPGEKFSEQPIGAFCSGTLVGEDIIMTAGHCITDQASCSDTKFIFGYNIADKDGAARTTVPSKDVYGCKRIIKRDLDKQYPGIFGTVLAIIKALLNKAGPDYALVQLDRKVTDRAPLAVNRKNIKAGTPVFVIGHPVGLPVKIAGDAKVRDAGHRAWFSTDLDTFGGNSGSAVFNANTNLIEGILVRGGTDFADSPAGCKTQFRTGQNEGRGEAVTKIARLQKQIPQLTPKSQLLGPVNMAPVETPAPSPELAGQIQF